MAKLLVLLVIALVCVIVNGQNQAPNQQPVVGQTFDEIIVSSDLNVRRKSKENRQGKKLLTNVPSGTTGPPGKSTAVASRLVSSDGSHVTLEKRQRRDVTKLRERFLNLGVAGYLLDSRK
ncbi:uncharacterized protein LOC107264142 [Cephus cinctus]|uniref:Uncharacterized protein LOC107264142 n=1 Tax=Cephus cinctus TaxID=211228 RepID=A0AAJ7BK96_CEPCN|nr:uncharacterized protein LOC107264142 [Cephus cinctus]